MEMRAYEEHLKATVKLPSHKINTTTQGPAVR